MGFNFPNSPTPGQLYTPVGGYQYVYLDGVWRVVESPQSVGTAQTRNRIVNPAMQVSQENGTTVLTANTAYPADQWQVIRTTASTISVAQGKSATGANQPYAISMVASPVLASAPVTDIALFQTPIEGIRIADFLWGSVQAKQAIIAFDVAVPVAGTYWVSIKSDTASHTFLGSYIVSASEIGTYVRKSVVIPAGAINAGTWATTATRAAIIGFPFHCGANGVGVAGFQSGNFHVGPGAALGLSSTAGYLTNIGLYLDPLATGIAPPWQMPDEAEELRACRRYYETQSAIVSTTPVNVPIPWNAYKRTAPAITQNSVIGTGLVLTSIGFDCWRMSTANSQLSSLQIVGNSRM